MQDLARLAFQSDVGFEGAGTSQSAAALQGVPAWWRQQGQIMPVGELIGKGNACLSLLAWGTIWESFSVLTFELRLMRRPGGRCQ